MTFIYDIVNGEKQIRGDKFPASIQSDNSINELDPVDTGIISGLIAMVR